MRDLYGIPSNWISVVNTACFGRRDKSQVMRPCITARRAEPKQSLLNLFRRARPDAFVIGGWSTVLRNAMRARLSFWHPAQPERVNTCSPPEEAVALTEPIPALVARKRAKIRALGCFMNYYLLRSIQIVRGASNLPVQQTSFAGPDGPHVGLRST